MPTPRKNHAASVNGRVERIQSALSRRVTRAAIANANGIANSVYPEYSIGGWIIMLGWRSNGLRPLPSGGTGDSVLNGDSMNTSSATKNVAKPHSTAVAYGASSRRRPRVMNRIALDHTDSSVAHSSSDPSCDDQIAVAR